MPETAKPAFFKLLGKKQGRIGGNAGIVSPVTFKTQWRTVDLYSPLRFGAVDLQKIRVAESRIVSYTVTDSSLQLFFNGIQIPVLFIIEPRRYIDVFENFKSEVGAGQMLHPHFRVFEGFPGKQQRIDGV